MRSRDYDVLVLRLACPFPKIFTMEYPQGTGEISCRRTPERATASRYCADLRRCRSWWRRWRSREMNRPPEMDPEAHPRRGLSCGAADRPASGCADRHTGCADAPIAGLRDSFPVILAGR